MRQSMIRIGRAYDHLITIIGITNQENLHTRLQSKLNDGEQVEPAPAKPESGQVHKARHSDRELARE